MTAELLKQVEHWHRVLALQIAALNPNLPLAEPDRVARHLVLALLCFPLYRQRKLVTEAEIQALCSYDLVRSRLLQINHDCGYLFPISGLPATVRVDDDELTAALRELNSASFEVEFLGQAYESCLGRWRSLSLAVSPLGIPHPAPATSQKPDVKKAGGIYYTPVAVAEYIVQQTVGRLLKTWPVRCPVMEAAALNESLLLEHDRVQIAQLPRVLDPNCGGGVFLLATYRLLLAETAPHLTRQVGTVGPNCTQLTQLTQLTQAERSHILLQCIHGVDIDPDAIAVTRLSLLLVLLEDSPKQSPKNCPENLPENPSETLGEERSPLPDLRHTIRVGNSLVGSEWSQPAFSTPEAWGDPLDWPTAFPAAHARGGFDAVIGNPPYLDSEWMTAHLPQHRRYCTQHYRAAVGNWDLFCVFIEKALVLCKPGGFTSLVVPNKLASAEYAAATRSLLTQTAHLLVLRDYSRVAVFAAAVYPLVYVAQKAKIQKSKAQKSKAQKSDRGLPSGLSVNPSVPIRYEQMRSLEQVDNWHWLSLASHIANPKAPWPLGKTTQTNLMTRLAQRFPPLAACAEVRGAATVAEAYALQPLLQEWQQDNSQSLRVVNSGTLDRYRILWGKKRLRYLGASYLQPVVAEHLIEHLPPTRQQQATQPKILVAGMTKRLECALDATGTILAAKSTCIIQVSDQSDLDLRYVLGLLNSRLMQVYFTQCFAGNTLQGGYLRVGPPQLRQLPLPLAAPYLCDRLIALVAAMLELCGLPDSPGNLEAIATLDHEIDQVVYEIYHLSQPEIANLEN